MYRITKYLIVIVSILTETNCLAGPVALSKIRDYASGYLQAITPISTANTKSKVLDIDSIMYGGVPYMYVCQDGYNWIVLANESSIEPILCRGEGVIDVSSQSWLNPVIVEYLLANKMAIDSIRQSSYKTISNALWDDSPSLSVTRGKIELGLTQYWKQTENNNGIYDHTRIYNKFCPDFYDISDGRTYVGCTAVAMGLVMKYWEWPDHANIPIRIDVAGITYPPSEVRYYDWKNMPIGLYNNTPMYQVDAVAGLLRDCGYAGHMVYGPGGSSMTLINAKTALVNMFKYHVAGPILYTSGANQFNNTIINEIENRRPVIFQATHRSDGGAHTFVIDGYNSSSNELHVNLGWGRYSIMWTSMSGATRYAEYTVDPRIIYEIQPDCSQRTDVRYPTYTSVDANTCRTEFSTNDIYFSNSSPLVVNPSGHLIAESGSRIILKPGFHACLGSNVRLSIKDFPCYDEDSRSGSPDASQVHGRRIMSKEDNGTSVLLVSPNPTSSTIQVSGVETGADIRIYSQTGVPVIQTTETNINVSAFPSGIYILIAFDSNGFQQTKFIKE